MNRIHYLFAALALLSIAMGIQQARAEDKCKADKAERKIKWE